MLAGEKGNQVCRRSLLCVLMADRRRWRDGGGEQLKYLALLARTCKVFPCQCKRYSPVQVCSLGRATVEYHSSGPQCYTRAVTTSVLADYPSALYTSFYDLDAPHSTNRHPEKEQAVYRCLGELEQVWQIKLLVSTTTYRLGMGQVPIDRP